MTARLRAVPADHVPLSTAVSAYLDTMPHQEQARTRAAYAATLSRLAADLGAGTGLSAIAREHLADWMQGTHATNAPPTWNRARDVLRSAWSYWAECGWVAEHPERAWPVAPRAAARRPAGA